MVQPDAMRIEAVSGLRLGGVAEDAHEGVAHLGQRPALTFEGDGEPEDVEVEVASAREVRDPDRHVTEPVDVVQHLGPSFTA